MDFAPIRSLANEYMPENFGTVTMLYIDIAINKCPIQVCQKLFIIRSEISFPRRSSTAERNRQ